MAPWAAGYGFYLLLRSMEKRDAVQLIIDTFRQIAEYSGEIPGAAAAECGNYREHDLAGAKREAEQFLPVIRDWTVARLRYQA